MKTCASLSSINKFVSLDFDHSNQESPKSLITLDHSCFKPILKMSVKIKCSCFFVSGVLSIIIGLILLIGTKPLIRKEILPVSKIVVCQLKK